MPDLLCDVSKQQVAGLSVEILFHGILLGFSPCGGLRFHLGFDFAVGPYAEHSRVVQRLNFRPGDLEHPEWNSRNTSWDLNVCAQSLPFDGMALTR